MMIDLTGFRFSHPIEIRFADLDVLGHVNNAKYFTYMETGRLLYFKQVIGWSGKRHQLNVILARTACDFKLPLELGDPIRVYVRVARLGNKSFDFEYVIIRETDHGVAAVGSSVQVAFDYKRKLPVLVPNEWRKKIIAFEPFQPEEPKQETATPEAELRNRRV